MKSVLISIKPKWCELIANGKKTVEIRKRRPKMDTPFKCYVYCTKDNHGWVDFSKKERLDGKVIGEFVCNEVDRIAHCGTCNNDIRLNIVDKNLYHKELSYDYLSKSKLSYYYIDKYSNARDVYGWHISDLVIYDKPKELSDYHKYISYFDGISIEELEAEGVNGLRIKRPPQSWCYVEEIERN